jgi:hypothetical protein
VTTKKVAVVARITAAGRTFVSLAIAFHTIIYPIAKAYAGGLAAVTGGVVAADEDTKSEAETAHYTASSPNGSSSPPS